MYRYISLYSFGSHLGSSNPLCLPSNPSNSNPNPPPPPPHHCHFHYHNHNPPSLSPSKFNPTSSSPASSTSLCQLSKLKPINNDTQNAHQIQTHRLWTCPHLQLHSHGSTGDSSSSSASS